MEETVIVIRNTSKFPTDEVKSLIKFATSEVDMRRVCVNVKGASSQHWAGHAYPSVPGISNAPPSSLYLVTINIAPDITYPFHFQYMKRSAPQIFVNWRELLVSIASHEAKHVEQFRENLKKSELRCEAFAAFTLRRYRESLGGLHAVLIAQDEARFVL